MRVAVKPYSSDVYGPSSPSLVIVDLETGFPVAEVAVRGAGYVVLSEEEKQSISDCILSLLNIAVTNDDGIAIPYHMILPDREDGYQGEPQLWRVTAEAQAAKRGAPTKVVKMGGKKVKVPTSMDDIQIPEGAKLDAKGIVLVPSRTGEDADGKRHRRACKRARAQQLAFLESQKNPSAVEDGEPDKEDGDGES